LFNVSEQWLIGNETKFKNAMLDVETTKSEYVRCKLIEPDIECIKKIEAERENKTKILKDLHNATIDEFIEFAKNKLIYKRKLLEENRILLADATKKVNFVTGLIWTILNCIFVVGGMLGAFTSKYVLDVFGRKIGLVLNGLFSISGGILVVMAPYVNSPVCVIASRFLFGIQGGMACSLVPTYLSEISPHALRGRTGVMAQLNITVGILFGQILGNLIYLILKIFTFIVIFLFNDFQKIIWS
jgi:MFS family permease